VDKEEEEEEEGEHHHPHTIPVHADIASSTSSPSQQSSPSLTIAVMMMTPPSPARPAGAAPHSEGSRAASRLHRQKPAPTMISRYSHPAFDLTPPLQRDQPLFPRRLQYAALSLACPQIAAAGGSKDKGLTREALGSEDLTVLGPHGHHLPSRRRVSVTTGLPLC
jgi:hypothetical protein